MTIINLQGILNKVSVTEHSDHLTYDFYFLDAYKSRTADISADMDLLVQAKLSPLNPYTGKENKFYALTKAGLDRLLCDVDGVQLRGSYKFERSFNHAVTIHHGIEKYDLIDLCLFKTLDNKPWLHALEIKRHTFQPSDPLPPEPDYLPVIDFPSRQQSPKLKKAA